MLQGKCKIVSADTEINASAGDFFYIPKGLPYQSYWQDEQDVSFLSLGFPYFPNPDKKNYPLQVIAADDAAIALMKRVPIGIRPSAEGIAALYALLAHLIGRMQDSIPCRSRQIVLHTERLLWENTELSPAELARSAGVCESALYAAFAKLGEGTLHEMKERILFEKAKNLLLTTDTPIEQISSQLNFCSCTYFRKRFKKHFGLSPRDVRKSGAGL
jgi:AraC-like DNA-binding protein